MAADLCLIDMFRLQMLMPIVGEDDQPKFDDTEAGKQAELSYFRKLLAVTSCSRTCTCTV